MPLALPAGRRNLGDEMRPPEPLPGGFDINLTAIGPTRTDISDVPDPTSSNPLHITPHGAGEVADQVLPYADYDRVRDAAARTNLPTELLPHADMKEVRRVAERSYGRLARIMRRHYMLVLCAGLAIGASRVGTYIPGFRSHQNAKFVTAALEGADGVETPTTAIQKMDEVNEYKRKHKGDEGSLLEQVKADEREGKKVEREFLLREARTESKELAEKLETANKRIEELEGAGTTSAEEIARLKNDLEVADVSWNLLVNGTGENEVTIHRSTGGGLEVKDDDLKEMRPDDVVFVYKMSDGRRIAVMYDANDKGADMKAVKSDLGAP